MLGSADRLSANEIYDRTYPGVVYIRARTVQPGADAFKADAGSELSLSTGSGFVLDGDGRVVTNAHVVNGVTAVEVTFPDGQIVAARVIGKDQETDLAVLAVDPEGLDLRPLELGESGAAQPGDQVDGDRQPERAQPTAGTGRIAAADQQIEAPGGFIVDGLLQTDAVIEPATSGGPLLGADGRVVAVTTLLSESAGDATYAIPIATVRGHARPARGEPQGDPPVPRAARAHRAPAASRSSRSSRAARPSARACTSATRSRRSTATRRSTLAELLEEVDRHQPGQSVRLRVLRDGSRGDVDVQLDERPATVPGS